MQLQNGEKCDKNCTPHAAAAINALRFVALLIALHSYIVYICHIYRWMNLLTFEYYSHSTSGIRIRIRLSCGQRCCNNWCHWSSASCHNNDVAACCCLCTLQLYLSLYPVLFLSLSLFFFLSPFSVSLCATSSYFSLNGNVASIVQ